MSLVREMVKQQAEVLKVAMEAQKAQAEVLSKWMGMFAPSPTPHQSTSEMDRAVMRESMEKSHDWEPIEAPIFPASNPEDFLS